MNAAKPPRVALMASTACACSGVGSGAEPAALGAGVGGGCARTLSCATQPFLSSAVAAGRQCGSCCARSASRIGSCWGQQFQQLALGARARKLPRAQCLPA